MAIALIRRALSEAELTQLADELIEFNQSREEATHSPSVGTSLEGLDT